MKTNKLIVFKLPIIFAFFVIGCNGSQKENKYIPIKDRNTLTFFNIQLGEKLDKRFKKQNQNLYCMKRTDDFEMACVRLDSNKKIKNIILYRNGNYSGYNYANNIFNKLSTKYQNLKCEKYFHNVFKHKQVGLVCNAYANSINIKFELSGKPNGGSITNIDDYMRLSYTLIDTNGI